MNRTNSQPDSDWELVLSHTLPDFGHRNWIVIADAAYPAHSSPGIKTIATGADHLDVLRKVMAALSSQKHVRPIIYADQELARVSDNDAPGVDAYRSALQHLLASHDLQVLPHEQIISRLDQAASLFRVLILKTTLCIPYTSVFLSLDCGYWTAEAEARLRTSLATSGPSLSKSHPAS
ncbi:MAG: RbsD/FucU domain-containing protein [Terracidiphilus sp.]|nr:RbsD/FucU domain-containing protein [Terracidiphilus sp.]